MSTAPNASATAAPTMATILGDTTPATTEAVESTESQPTTAEMAESTETTATEAAPAESEQSGVAAAQETTETETTHAGYDQLLPWEQLDSYPPELLNLAARKFGIDPKLVPQIQSLLKGKIDADIHARNLEQQLPSEDGGSEAGFTDSEAAGATPIAASPTELTDSYKQAVATAQSLVTDEGAELYIKSLADVQGKLQKAYQSNDPAAIKAASREALQTQFGLFLMGLRQVLPQVLPSMLNETVQGEQQRISLYKTARERLAKDPRYGDIDQLYTAKVFQRVMADDPELPNRRFKDATGKVLPLDSPENAMAQYKYAIHLYRGQQVGSPAELVKKGIETGKKQAEAERNRNDLGKLNAGGRSTGKAGGGEGDWMTQLVESDKARNPMTHIPRADAFGKKG